jgi:putative pyoverdin transport system ATP-binding/permease protein
MSAFAFVIRSAGYFGFVLAALGVVGAACNAGLIGVVHRALAAQGGGRDLALAFVGLGLGKALTAYVSGRVADSYSRESMAELRRELIAKLLLVPYLHFERLGSARAYAALTTDVMMVNGAVQSSAALLVNCAVLLGGAAYLLYLDARALVVLSVFGIVGFGIYRAMSGRARVMLRLARKEHDRLLSHFRALTGGAKELRLHAGRRRAFLDGPLLETTEQLLAHELEGNARYLLGQAVNSLLVLAMIGIVLFALGGEQGMGGGVASGYVLVGLYLTGPLASLMRLLPQFASAEIALARIADVGVQLGSPSGEASADPSARPSFASIELRGVTHRYEDDSGFALGPISLRIAPAEILFITGGNGSGKSTLAKLLAGLYEPMEGEVVWDGHPVGPATRDAYRQLWSAVFSEFHLFDRFYGLSGPDLDARARELVQTLDLAHAVQVDAGALSTLDLSRGQRKRLALLTALLEDRPLYLLDEWAADQDPEFKQIFYQRLVPELKRRGKAVVVITHDDRYFGVADRLVQLRDGKAYTNDDKAALTS